MALSAGALFAVNGIVAKVILAHGMSSLRLTQARSIGAFVGFALILLATRPAALRTTRRELLRLALFGVAGVAFVQLFYFLALHRLQVGVALLIQYLAPLLVALWARFVAHEHVRRRIWIALALALVGLSLVVDLWRGVGLDTLGVVYAACAAVAFAAYLLLGERAVGTRDPVSLLCFGFFFASLFWAVVQPWWSFPYGLPGRTISLLGNLDDVHLPLWALLLWMICLGTIAPFFLLIGSMQHISATQAGLLAMIEPVLATVIAYLWLDQTLGASQLVGGAVVLAGILLAQTARAPER
jgi:drug/metabolite transporter (DMT)-like permease